MNAILLLNKNKVFAFAVTFTILFTSIFIYDILIEQSTEELNWNCCGIIATGTCVKDNRSIFWKSRHSGSTPGFDKPLYYEVGYDNTPLGGVVSNGSYAFITNQGVTWGYNERGLAVGNFAQGGQLNNYDFLQTSPIIGHYYAMRDCLANMSTVLEAAYHLAYHASGSNTFGVISEEQGVGAIVSVGSLDPVGRIGHIYWVNNSWEPLNNAYWQADGDGGDSVKRATVTAIGNDIINNGGINGDYLIDWQEIIQRGVCNARDKELGTGTFYLDSNELCKYSGPSSICAVGGNPSLNGSANLAWMCHGNCNGLFAPIMPLAVSYLETTNDMPLFWRTNNRGMYDDVEIKRVYAEDGGTSAYSCERTQEIHEYKKAAENWTFDAYDAWYTNFSDGEYSTPTEAQDSLEVCIDSASVFAFENYVNETVTPLFFNWIPEDINNDGTVDYQDTGAVALEYGNSGDPGWIPEDVNDDGTVNYQDTGAVALHYGESYG